MEKEPTLNEQLRDSSSHCNSRHHACEDAAEVLRKLQRNDEHAGAIAALTGASMAYKDAWDCFYELGKTIGGADFWLSRRG